jgi:hypothetical protein
MADDVADRILAGSREGVQDPERGHEPSRQKRRVPTGAGPGRAEHDQGVSVFAYDADGPEVFGLGPGLTVLMGLPPPTPSAMAFRMTLKSGSIAESCRRAHVSGGLSHRRPKIIVDQVPPASIRAAAREIACRASEVHVLAVGTCAIN